MNTFLSNGICSWGSLIQLVTSSGFMKKSVSLRLCPSLHVSFLVSLSPSYPSSSEVCSFWMIRFYEQSDKEKGGWRAEREGEVEDRGGCRDKEEEAADEEPEVGTGLVFITPVWMLPNNIFSWTKCSFLRLCICSKHDDTNSWYQRLIFCSFTIGVVIYF